MKKIILTLFLFTINIVFSQKYTIIVIKEPETMYDFAKKMGERQNQMQAKFDYNHERINYAITDITNQILKFNYPANLRANIGYGLEQILKEVDNCMGGDAMMSNSTVTNMISQMTNSINRVISYEVKSYNNSRTYNNYEFEFCTKYNYSQNDNYEAVEMGKNNLNYKFSFGFGIGLKASSSNSENVNQVNATVRIGKKATIENLFEKFSANNQNNIPVDYFKNQFAITSIYNYHTSLFSQSLFLVTGAGISYSKNYISNNNFENKINPVINLGIDYNFKKIPFSLGFYNKLDYFGSFSSLGFRVNYLIR